jgi:hypothetical protein
MLDLSHLPVGTGAADVQLFFGTSTAAGNDWQTWVKPRGKTMLQIALFGKGGNGGTGVIGANSTAAGGGGGGSGGQTILTMPLALLPDALFLSLAGRSATTTLASYIALAAKLTAGAGAPTANDTLMIANGGGNGGNAAGATAGAAGAAGAIATAATMPLGWGFAIALAGQAGIIGGTTVTAGNLTLPVTGLLLTGGTGGGGLPAAAAAGTNGGDINGAGQFFTLKGGQGNATATVPAAPGSAGCQPMPKIGLLYGGTGAASTHGTATGGGLVQGSGGDGAPGCGGGGGGGALTGSAAGVVGQGVAFAIFTCW